MPHVRKDLNIVGADLWYLVGLITSDGNMSKDGRHINITSKDYAFLDDFRNAYGLTNKIGTKNKGKINQAYQIQLANIDFYNFLLSIGLSPNKSLVQKDLFVPECYFGDFLRGLIDGDGSIRNWLHPENLREQWTLRISSGSRDFLKWLKDKIEKIFRVKGRIHQENKKGTSFRLKYGKLAAMIILEKSYCKDVFSLNRKAELADKCINSYKGWERSKTVLVDKDN